MHTLNKRGSITLYKYMLEIRLISQPHKARIQGGAADHFE